VHELLGGVREQDLSAVASRTEPGDAVECVSEIVAVALLGDSDVERDTDAERGKRLPGLGEQRVLGGEGRFEGGGGGGEDGLEGVADGLDHLATVGIDGLAQQGVVAGEGLLHIALLVRDYDQAMTLS
jgi:hypothetical protein